MDGYQLVVVLPERPSYVAVELEARIARQDRVPLRRLFEMIASGVVILTLLCLM
jgi:hypothetical protein